MCQNRYIVNPVNNVRIIYFRSSPLYKGKPLVTSADSLDNDVSVFTDVPPLSYVDLQRDSLGYAIKRAQVRTYGILFNVLGPDSLTTGRMTALSIIATQHGINQSVLADMLGITRAGVVKVIDSLQSGGYVRRQPIPEDRRSYSLEVTERGYAELRRLNMLLREHEKQIAAKLTARERKQLIALLEKVAAE